MFLTSKLINSFSVVSSHVSVKISPLSLLEPPLAYFPSFKRVSYNQLCCCFRGKNLKTRKNMLLKSSMEREQILLSDNEFKARNKFFSLALDLINKFFHPRKIPNMPWPRMWMNVSPPAEWETRNFSWICHARFHNIIPSQHFSSKSRKYVWK